MKWTTEVNPWRRAFAFFPVTLRNGPTATTIWLEWYWRRPMGDGTEVSFTEECPPT